MEVELIRHGATAWQKEGRYQGKSDIPLSPEGRNSLIPAEGCPDVVYVTSLLRTRETARILFPKARQEIVPGLEEMDFGVFEGRTAREMEADEAYRDWVESGCLSRCPGGESREQFSDRVCLAFDDLLRSATLRGEPGLTIVAHGGTLMALLERFGKPRQEYFQWMTDCGCGFRLRAENWTEDRSLVVREQIKLTK
ncbi:MAG: histidine phosphatase family protein [Oscillospiraceae bacterium]|nr:histidine phosphatase family protein [Oscillospiraceae bacterium]